MPNKEKVLDIATDFIAKEEGFKPYSYLDQAGVRTIGYGTVMINGEPVKEGQTCTEEEAKEWMREHIEKDYDRYQLRYPTDHYINLTSNEMAAVLSFIYNLGFKAFEDSTLAKEIYVNRHLDIAAREFLKWDKVRIDGVLTSSPGLLSRRRREMELFEKQENE